jgi:hypothetical protein
MKIFWRLLGRWFDKRNGVVRDQKMVWTRISKPLSDMTPEERKKVAERIAENFFRKG